VWHRIAGVTLHHSLNHVLYHPEFLPPPPKKKMQMWPPHWPPQTAAARNAPGTMTDLLCPHNKDWVNRNNHFSLSQLCSCVAQMAVCYLDRWFVANSGVIIPEFIFLLRCFTLGFADTDCRYILHCFSAVVWVMEQHTI